MTNTFTTEHRTKLEDYLRTHELPSGLGTKESACSIAAINLSISGSLTDDIPECMSKVLGTATIRLQDAMPDEMRNSERYRRLLPDMAGTGREHEQERAAIILDWMWSVVLPQVQPIADKRGFGDAWAQMCKKRTSDAAAYAADTDYAAAYAADTAAYAAHAYARAAAALAADYAADAAAYAAAAAVVTYADAAYADFWATVDPIGVLERMTYLKGQDDE